MDIGKWEKPSGDDSHQHINDESTAFFLSVNIDRNVIDHVSGPFLGLGPGGAKAELKLASKYGIMDVTLVDKYPVPIEGFKGKYLEADIFDFIKQTEEKFGFLTMIGLDYVLEHRGNWELAWNGIEKITKPGAIVVIYPEPNFDVPFEDFRVLAKDGCLICQRV